MFINNKMSFSLQKNVAALDSWGQFLAIGPGMVLAPHKKSFHKLPQQCLYLTEEEYIGGTSTILWSDKTMY